MARYVFETLGVPLSSHLLCVENDSPYPEVRSAVANYDDPSIPVSTFRAWIFGLTWAIVIPGVNQFFYLRYPSIMVTGVRNHAE